jgi:uracil-DNA glycosylase
MCCVVSRLIVTAHTYTLFFPDPYHTPGQANGMAFSCETTPLQPSLRNIFAEISRDFGTEIQDPRLKQGDLSPWATQGVLLLNASLTVRAHNAASHKNIGWQHLTQTVVKRLSTFKQPLVFLMWGRHAHDAVRHIVNPRKHLILKASHPSPYSYQTHSASAPAFEGCGHFRLCNQFLEKHNLPRVKWF